MYFCVDSAPDGGTPSENVIWLRPKQFCPGSPKLYADGNLGAFVGSAGISDIEGTTSTIAVYGVGANGSGCLQQGQIANLWFLNALSLVASRPSLLRNLFVATGQEKQGRFCIQFFKEERWLNVFIDDCLPCNYLGVPLFTTSIDPNEIWPMLLEKAYAKLHGCYESLIRGQVEYALRDLTGGTVQRISLHKEGTLEVRAEVSPNKFWEEIKRWVCNSGKDI